MVKFYGITSDIPVEISSRIWWYYQWYISGITVEIIGKNLVVLPVVYGKYTSGISVVLPVVYQWEISGKIWWYYHCYPLI